MKLPSRRGRKPQGEQKVQIALGTSVYSNAIVQKTVSINKLFSVLSTHKEQQEKDGPYFVFASFKGEERNAAAVDKYYGAVIDFDDVEMSVEEIQEIAAPYTYCMYTTFSHTLEGKGNRYRMVFPYKKPVKPSVHVDLVLYLTDLFGIEGVDLSSKTLSLPMYRPAYCAENEEEVFALKHKGRLFDPWNSAIEDALPEIRLRMLEDTENDYVPVDINREISEGERNSELARLVGKLIKNGSSKETIADMAASFNDTKIVPPLSTKEVDTIVNSVLKAHTRNTKDLDWGFDEIMQRMEKPEEAKDSFDHLCKLIANAKLKKNIEPAQFEILTNELSKKTSVGKKTIKAELTQASLELQGEQEEQDENNVLDNLETFKERFRHWVYVATDDKFYNSKNSVALKVEAFNRNFQPADMKPALAMILTKYSLVQKVERLEFDPLNEWVYTRDGVRYVNTYIAPSLEPMEGDVEPLIKHFHYLFSLKEEAELLLDYIAFMVQNTGEKIRWMPVIKGGKGIGKSIIAEHIISPLVGRSNIGKVSNALIKSDFNSWQLNKQVVVFEELNVSHDPRKKQEFTDSLKSFITDDVISAHLKGKDSYDVMNRACCLAFTNNDDAVSITMDERRFCMMLANAIPKTDRYYQNFVKWCAAHQGQMLNFFLERDVSKFRPQRAPETAYTQQVRYASLPWPTNIIYGLIEGEFPETSEYGAITLSQLTDLIKANSTGDNIYKAETAASIGSGYYKLVVGALVDSGFLQFVRSDKIMLKKHAGNDRALKNVSRIINPKTNKRETIWILPKRARDFEPFKKPSSFSDIWERVEVVKPAEVIEDFEE